MPFPAPPEFPPRRRSRGTLAWLAATQLLAAASLLPWLGVAGPSVAGFAAPREPGALAPWVFLGVVWSYPLLPVGCAAAAWIAYARRRNRRAALLSAASLVPALPLLAYLFWVSSPA